MHAETAEVMAGAYVSAKGRLREAAEAIPLLGVAVEAKIAGPFTRVVMRQRYRNQGAKPIEAVYVFPAPEKAPWSTSSKAIASSKGAITRR